mgnify:CR=1 FL=1
MIEIAVPSLNDRINDVPLLVKHFSKIISEEHGTPNKEFGEDAIKNLQNLNWTGNIRELRNVVERLMILGENPVTSNDLDVFVKKYT